MNYLLQPGENNQFSLCPIEEVAEKSKKNKINEMLMYACKLGNVAKVISLIENEGADLHLADLHTLLQCNQAGNSPLHIAAGCGYNDIVGYLLSKGSDIQSDNKRFASPLHSAVYKGRIETVKLLISHGAEIESLEDEGDTPLAWASYTGCAKIVRYLLSQGANINNRNKLLYTPLHWACYKGNLSVVKILIKNGADLVCKNAHNETPIICASNCGRNNVYTYLYSVQEKRPILQLIKNDLGK